jgi:glucosylceramidase
MKLGGELCGGWIDINKLPVFCDYYVKFLQQYAAQGIEVGAISAQNEPYSDQNGESPECKWGPNEEMLFVGKLMPQRLKAAGFKTEIWLHDSEPDEWRQVLAELADEDVRKNTGGIAFHSYGGNPLQFLPMIREKHPDLKMYHTEQGPHLDGSRTITWWGAKVSSFINAGCSAFTSWCLALDEQGLPNVSRGFNCAGFIEIHSETGKFTPRAQWDLFRHIGPYVSRGAKVLDANYAKITPHPGSIPSSQRHVMAFRNPDGSHVIVATNSNGGNNRKLQLQVKLRGQYVSFQLPSKSVSTIILK